MAYSRHQWNFRARVFLYLLLLVWGFRFMLMDFQTNEIAGSFWHIINLGFDEAGHLLFQPFGRFMAALGGTLGQLIAPIALATVFIIRNEDYFGASLCCWWLGQSLMDCAPYINDALAQRLTLLGGGTGRDSPGSHDWNYLLNQLGMIAHHRAIAIAFDVLGMLIMLLAIIWGGILLYRQFKSEHVV